MPSHFSTIGFHLDTLEDLAALAERLAGRASAVPVKGGQYLRWSGGAGEEVWLQQDPSGSLVGANPHYDGKSALRVGLTATVNRENDTALDGAFHAWMDPDGEYPFVFDAPDFRAHAGLARPAIAEVQVSAFAHEISYFESANAFESSQADQEVKFGSRSFIPTGLFTPQGSDTAPPDSLAHFTGHVLEAATRRNALTGNEFYWALVDTFGGAYDVVIDPDLLASPPAVGGVLSGTYWLSGRIVSARSSQRGVSRWLRRLIGRGGR